MSIEFVDFHCHLDLYPDPEAAMAECEREGVHTLTVTTTPKAWPHNCELAAKFRFVRVALGLHPQLIAERAAELKLWETYLPQSRYIGEIGLDAGPRFYKSIQLQKKVFERILILCEQAGGKILSVHSVRTAATVLDMIEKHLTPARSRVVLHWFAGTKAEAQRAVELGCFFSINANMMRIERNRNLVEVLPLDRVLTETDGPFCQHEGRAIRPVDVSAAIELLAKSKASSRDAIAGAVLSNLHRVESIA